MYQAARELHKMGAKAVLVKGGHLEGDAIDVLYTAGFTREFRAPRIETRHTHGTGCAYSAAITAELARGALLEDAVACAKAFIKTGANEPLPSAWFPCSLPRKSCSGAG